ncbi:hypothetical protein [Enterococcus casseliflavus]|uniref:hypothetical protein n=1 Tax=Enterococcus casseliflavus TaxID=37734 RepID=UPI00289036A8|nr:hypothetical protein [Enterococcus casseliflavus]MDT2961537.1 hypothetical protein [Enterococcus casseliflavus]
MEAEKIMVTNVKAKKITVSVDTNIPELSEKVKRLQQVVAEAEKLIEEINDFSLEVSPTIINS